MKQHVHGFGARSRLVVHLAVALSVCFDLKKKYMQNLCRKHGSLNNKRAQVRNIDGEMNVVKSIVRSLQRTSSAIA